MVICHTVYMPELPEVETVKRGLEKLIVDKKIVSVDFDWPKSFPNEKAKVDQYLIGSSVKSVARRAKVLIVNLNSDYSLVAHLKMTGQFVYRGSTSFGAGHPNDSLIGSLPDKSTRITFTFEDGSRLFFNDQRKFGWVRFFPTLEVPNIDFMKKLGPEPLETTFKKADFRKRIKRRLNSNIKSVLLDQTVVAGVGNIYADESLWGAKIHPKTLVKNISDEKLNNLYIEVRKVLELSIEKGGSTDRNYVNAEGKKGSYIEFARVFRREGKDCYRCGEQIIKTRVASRGTHICPKCQKEAIK
jgi:formamidopyrimidine-DNA glycosylase